MKKNMINVAMLCSITLASCSSKKAPQAQANVATGTPVEAPAIYYVNPIAASIP